ncbi:MAG: hypothetical protein ACI9R3_005490 [Verrucomicrobiales bacterium]|jgi:hypothetical protein
MILATSGWLTLFGFDQSEIPEGSEASLTFEYMPQSWGVFVLVAAIIGVIWFSFAIYRRESGSASPWMKRVLAILRIAAFALAILILLGPSVVFTKTRILRPMISLVRDASLSMTTEDPYHDPRSASATAELLGVNASEVRAKQPARTEIVNAFFDANDKALLTGLEKRGRLQLIDFTDNPSQPQRIAGAAAISSDESDATVDENGEPADEGVTIDLQLPPLVTGGSGTDVAAALSLAIKEKLTAAVVMTTDGQHNADTDLNAVAAEALERDIPLFVVGVGDAQKPRNLRVTDLYVDPQVWKGDPFELEALLIARGAQTATADVEFVELIESPDGGATQEKVLESRQIALDPELEEQQVRMSFQHTSEEVGTRTYTVRVKPIENETDRKDNAPQAPAKVTILDNQAKVLLISGAASWEFRSITVLLTREKTVDLSCWLQSLDQGREQQGNSRILSLPATKEELFAFDVVLMLDPDPREFDPAWMGLLKDFVRERSGGVLYMPGPVFGPNFITSIHAKAMQELIPVRIDEMAATATAVDTQSYDRAWPLQVVAANVDQPIMRFYPDSQKTLEQWKALPGIYWSFPAIASKPAARTLLEHSDPTLRTANIERPLIVTGKYGAGRTVYVGFEGTWLWRQTGREGEFFKRFWIQTVRYLVEGRSLGGKRRGIIEADKPKYQIGDRVLLTAKLQTLDYQPMVADEIPAMLSAPGEETKEVLLKKADGEDAGTYQVTLPAARPGSHSIKITLPGDESGPAEITADYTVTLPLRETLQTFLDRPALMNLATSTGGAYFDVNEAAALLDAVPDRTRKLEIQSTPKPLWDTQRMLILFVSLLALEWILRKRFKLI